MNDLKCEFVNEGIFMCGVGIKIAMRELLITCVADAEQALGAGGVSFIPLEAPFYQSVIGYVFYCFLLTLNNTFLMILPPPNGGDRGE